MSSHSLSSAHLGTVPFHAVILAAGVGKRLGNSSAGAARLPKIMMRFAGQSLLARHLAILRHAGVARVTVVVGYGAQSVRDALPKLGARMTVDAIDNPDFTEGSVISLWTAREVLQSGATIVLMDGDVLYDHRLMLRLIKSDHPNALLMDREIEPGDEPVKLCVRDGTIVDFRKAPTETYDYHGESVGFFRFTPQCAADLAERATQYVDTGQRMTEYEEPIRDMIMRAEPGCFGFEDISDLPWTEIDFPEDVAKAQALLPRLAIPAPC